MPLERILERYETKFLEESQGYYESYRLDPCFAGVTGYTPDSPEREALDRQTPFGYGDVVECVLATDPVGDSGEIWIIGLDDDGTVAVWGGGTGEEAGLIWNAPSGLLCSEFLSQSPLTAYRSDPDWPANSTWAYSAALAYWFIEGQPDRMDVDGNDIPCELLFDPEVVAEVWAGDSTGP